MATQRKNNVDTVEVSNPAAVTYDPATGATTVTINTTVTVTRGGVQQEYQLVPGDKYYFTDNTITFDPPKQQIP